MSHPLKWLGSMHAFYKLWPPQRVVVHRPPSPSRSVFNACLPLSAASPMECGKCSAEDASEERRPMRCHLLEQG
jgi:hypothetical protein